MLCNAIGDGHYNGTMAHVDVTGSRRALPTQLKQACMEVVDVEVRTPPRLGVEDT
jgi:hypothetical protein